MKQATNLRKVLNALVAAGWTITGVDDGDGAVQKTTTVNAVKLNR